MRLAIRCRLSATISQPAFGAFDLRTVRPV
jgi:hypothetical protein